MACGDFQNDHSDLISLWYLFLRWCYQYYELTIVVIWLHYPMGIFLLFAILYTDFKGIWIPRWSIADKNMIFTHLEGKFNHIFLQVFALGEAYYPSQYAPSRAHADEWLQEFLNEAHRRDIKVSAWVNVFYSWGYAPRTRHVNHPINRQPDWYVQDQFGRSILDYDIHELKSLGAEGYYLSPSKRQVRSYVAAILEELIVKYDFDGIHLDYIRYPGSDFVYDVSLRSKFMRKFSIDPRDIYTNPGLKTRFSLWGYHDLQKQWQEFIYYDLTTFVEDLSKNIKQKKPGIALSVAVKPNYLSARYEYYQDWMAWLNLGYVDFVCLMAYGKRIDSYLENILKVVDEPHRITVGLGLYLLNPQEIKKQVQLIKSTPFSGVVFFSYDQLKENRNYLNSLR